MSAIEKYTQDINFQKQEENITMLGLMEKNIQKHDNIRKFTTGKRDNDTTACLLDNPYFKDHYKLIVTDLMK